MNFIIQNPYYIHSIAKFSDKVIFESCDSRIEHFECLTTLGKTLEIEHIENNTTCTYVHAFPIAHHSNTHGRYLLFGLFQSIFKQQ